MRDPTTCSDCDGDLAGFYMMCDEDAAAAHCASCWERHPCAAGEHGEGCATAVWTDEEIDPGEDA